MALDMSFSKSGVAIFDFSGSKIHILLAELFTSNKDLDDIERIYETVNYIETLRCVYKIDLTIKESAIVGKSSTALPVIKTHGALEYHYFHDTLPLSEVHNSTLKSYCRRYLIENNHYTKEDIKQFNKKEIVAEFLKKYFDSDMKMIYTKRGRLIDDIADAIAIGVYTYEKDEWSF